MKAALQVGVGRYEVANVPEPGITGTQCLIRVGACTICATDAKYFTGQVQHEWPWAMGHEVAGVVEKVGSDVSGFREGDRVVSRMAWGGFAEYVASEADLLMRLPEFIGFEEGGIGQLLPIAVRGAELAVRPGKTVFVSGLGAAGLLCVQVAKAYGATRVIAADPFETRRAVAKKVGADVCLDPNAGDVAERVREETAGGADVAIEAAGAEASFRACEEAVRVGGIISVFGTHLKPMEVHLAKWEARSLQLHMMAEPPEEKPTMVRKAERLLANGGIRLKPLLSKVMKLDDIMEAFDLYLHRPEVYIKIAMVP
jgi:threonine dehydrogenase-like Zn-dependent dehydrogenase